mgnify:FL=1
MSINLAEEIVPVVLEGQVVELEKSAAELLQAPPVALKIDGIEVRMPRATLATDPNTGRKFPRLTTVYDAAVEAKVAVPVLCHREHMTPAAVCRLCTVEVGGRVLAAACHRAVEEGLDVKTHKTSPKVRKAVGILTELLLADTQVPRGAHLQGGNELHALAEGLGIDPAKPPRFPLTVRDRGRDESSLVIAVDHSACILCDRCVRGCNEIRNNQVLGRAGKGYGARVAFDLNDPMGESACVSCGECMVSCPTGALSNRAVVEAKPWAGAKPAPAPVSPEDLLGHALFEGISKAFLAWNINSVVRRTFQPGEVVCREGEYGSSAFIIEEGELEIFLQAEMKHVAKAKGAFRNSLMGLVRTVVPGLTRREKPSEAPDARRNTIPIDAPVSLDMAKPTATLTPADLLFGEMTCMSSYPRSATVRAKTRVSLLEIQRNVLYTLQRSKKAKGMLDEVYRRRSIDSHLRGVPMFADAIPDPAEFRAFVESLRDKVRLVRLNPGDTVFRQGDPADYFYLVRVGFVKISNRKAGSDLAIAYIGPGGHFGEIALLSRVEELGGKVPPGVRTATVTALDHVDLVAIAPDDFRDIMGRFPAIREGIIREANRRIDQHARMNRGTADATLGEFLRQGLMDAQSLLVLDLAKCTRCDECTKACADAHQGVTRLVREGLRFENFLVASSCRSCLDPHCMVGCPVGSIRRRASREIVIEDWCIGCGKCAENCPYGNINMHPFPTGRNAPDPDNPSRQLPVMQQKATMCDLCVSLDGTPSCVYACPHDAAHRMSGSQLINLSLHRSATGGHV